MKLSGILIGVSLAMMIVSCEFPLEEKNFVEVKKPADTVLINLSLFPEGDTIEVTGPTTISYNINTFHLSMYLAVFSLIDRTWEEVNPVGSIYLDPAFWSNGFYPMTLTIYTNSGSGSLADCVGTEGYMAKVQWIVQIHKIEPVDTSGIIHKPILTYSITEDKFLKISWAKCNSDDFEGYRIECSSSNFTFSHDIPEAKDSFYIDISYVGGTFAYKVGIITKSGVNISIWSDPLVIQKPFPTLEIEEFGLDSLRLSWNEPIFKCLFSLFTSKSYEFIIDMDTCRSVIIDHPGFPDHTTFTLYTVPYYALSYQYPYSCIDIKNYGSMPDAPGNSRYFAYNLVDDVIYTSSSSYIENYSNTDLTLLNSHYISLLGNCGKVSSMFNSTQTAAVSSDSIYIFQDQYLTIPEVIPFQSWGESVSHFFLADNGILTISKYNTNAISVIDVNQDTILYTATIDNYPSIYPENCMTTSQDGKYFASVSSTGISIYEIHDFALEEIYSDNRAYRSAFFNPNFPNQLVLTLIDNDEIEIRNCPDFSLHSSINFLPVIICNFDPKTGYMLVHDFHRFYVIDIETEEVLFSMNCNNYESMLLGNHLFSSNGYTFDISNYLK